MTAPAPVRLVVLRHAKSAWPDVPDADRPLAERGRADAPAAGRWLREHGVVPDLVVCSTAVRTRQTWELALTELGADPEVVFEPRAYRAEAEELVELLSALPAGTGTALLVGHRPEVQDLVLMLAGERESEPLARVREKYPTVGIAVLQVPGGWSRLAPGTAELTEFAVPRGTPGTGLGH
ncbi:histidine phosphatase family protein [Kitasatospora cinereorecta]|uniref:SixA phosphatase family protein n=1 Tax=Kitasatospora cinereorecta TaxID=285560 RepID=A0ABW0VGU9_9ACTN